MVRLLGRVQSSFSKRSPYRAPFRRHASHRSALSDQTEGRWSRYHPRYHGPYHGAATAVLAVLLLAMVGLIARLAWARFTRLEVEGVSMVPTFAPGDRVLVLRTRDVSVGDVVAIEDPQAQRVLVKRVVGIDRSVVRVEGDNAGASRDSRHFGPVPRTAVVGRVVTRYHSPRRR